MSSMIPAVNDLLVRPPILGDPDMQRPHGRATIYYNGGFTYRRWEVREVGWEGDSKPMVSVIPRNGRKVRCYNLGGNAVILAGWGHPDPPSGFHPVGDPPTHHESSSLGDPSLDEAFDAFLKQYLATHEVHVLADLRSNDPATTGTTVGPAEAGGPSPIPFRVGQTYTRHDVQRLIGLTPQQGGNWATGHHTEDKDTFIFANIGRPGRTGHQYNNQWIGDEFHWETKGNLRQDSPSVRAMLAPPPGGRVFIFTRNDDRAPFVYEGVGRPVEAVGNEPVKIIWRLAHESEAQPISSPNEITEPEKYVEGATRQVAVNVYERNPAARRACIAHHGCQCAVCRFDFEAVYGELGRGFIHVHHVVPLARLGAEYEVDPVADLRPVCPNCHAMVSVSRTT